MNHSLLFRHAILLQLQAAYPASVPLSTLKTGLKLASHSTETLEAELRYLSDKNLIKTQEHHLDVGSLRYRLSAEGREQLEREGLS